MKYLKIVTLGTLLMAVAACQTTRPVPSGMYHSQQKYLTYDQNKAMVGAVGTYGSYTFGWAWGHSNLENAIKSATQSCEKNKHVYEVVAECKLHFIGNKNVRSLSEEELKVAIADYKKNGEQTQ